MTGFVRKARIYGLPTQTEERVAHLYIAESIGDFVQPWLCQALLFGYEMGESAPRHLSRIRRRCSHADGWRRQLLCHFKQQCQPQPDSEPSYISTSNPLLLKPRFFD